jgi:hypothetical protein
MAATYSLAVTGVSSEDYGPFNVPEVIIPDASATAGGLANAAQTGTQMLCKNADGSQSWYVYDTDLSRPGKPVLRPVAP